MIRMRLRFRLWWLRRRAAIPCPQEAPAAKMVDDADLPRGPGWFDSSWDLMRGLEVSEGPPANASVDEWVMGLLGPVIPLEPIRPLEPARAQNPPPAPTAQNQETGEPQWELSPA